MNLIAISPTKISFKKYCLIRSDYLHCHVIRNKTIAKVNTNFEIASFFTKKTKKKAKKHILSQKICQMICRYKNKYYLCIAIEK